MEEVESGSINADVQDVIETPKVGMMFDSVDEGYMHYSRFAKQEGFAIVKRTTRNGPDGKRRSVGFACSRGRKAKIQTINPVKPRSHTKIECPAHLCLKNEPDGKWMISRFVLEHNHEISPSKARFLRCNRVIDERTKKKLELHDNAGIRLNKSYDSLQIEFGGASNISFTQRDCRNYLDKHRRSLLMEGDAMAMQNYFVKMTKDNSDFFHLMDLDSEGRLRNVFWADARSRAAATEFGDVVTFDTTYLVNRYDMPFAPFVGVNHHGQTILLGCGLISHEDTESFRWLFETWKTCMRDCAPKAIITDQCMAMKNAIECVFPLTRHRWCIWHIMKKIPEKFSGYGAYEGISQCLRHVVCSSQTTDVFDHDWDLFIQKYNLQDNSWLVGLYDERRRWVPAYVKDVFWAGMSSTQRSEGINAYFDGYIHSKTTLKQFVGQYENALANKVESENQADFKSWNCFIPLIQEEDQLEKQFQSQYTNAKVKEFQAEFVGKLKCSYSKLRETEYVSEYEVKEWIIFGEGDSKMRKQVAFNVEFHASTNETFCTCRLFEFRGMVCKHQLLVWGDAGIQNVPEKYVLRRWCKNVKRAHTKVRIGYNSLSMSVESERRVKMYNILDDVVDLAEDSLMGFEMVMTRACELKEELKLALANIGRHMGSLTLVNTSIPNSDQITNTQQSSNILDPIVLRRKGRPPSKRKQSTVEKIIRKKTTKKKNTSKGDEEVVVRHVQPTQETIMNVHGQTSYMGLLTAVTTPSHMQLFNTQQGAGAGADTIDSMWNPWV